MLLVPLAQLYGGKICAALDRQHPRDLFDVRLLLDNEGFTDEIRRGFLFGLVSSNRPTFELFDPHFLDQRAAFDNQFEGMSAIGFSYDEYEYTRIRLVETIQSGMKDSDREFLLSVNRLEPDWSIFDFQKFLSVKWKLENLEKFKRNNAEKNQRQLSRLERSMAL